MSLRDVTIYGPAPACDNPELALLLTQLDQATYEWSSELGEALTDDELIWQPFPGGHSIAGLLAHIAGVELYWLHHIAAGEPFRDLEAEALGAEIDQYAVAWPPPPRRPYAFYRELLEETRRQTRSVVAALKDPNRVISRTRSNGEVQSLTLRWILTHVILHEAYHGGQAVLLALQQRADGGKP